MSDQTAVTESPTEKKATTLPNAQLQSQQHLEQPSTANKEISTAPSKLHEQSALSTVPEKGKVEATLMADKIKSGQASDGSQPAPVKIGDQSGSLTSNKAGSTLTTAEGKSFIVTHDEKTDTYSLTPKDGSPSTVSGAKMERGVDPYSDRSQPNSAPDAIKRLSATSMNDLQVVGSEDTKTKRDNVPLSSDGIGARGESGAAAAAPGKGPKDTAEAAPGGPAKPAETKEPPAVREPGVAPGSTTRNTAETTAAETRAEPKSEPKPDIRSQVKPEEKSEPKAPTISGVTSANSETNRAAESAKSNHNNDAPLPAPSPAAPAPAEHAPAASTTERSKESADKVNLAPQQPSAATANTGSSNREVAPVVAPSPASVAPVEAVRPTAPVEAVRPNAPVKAPEPVALGGSTGGGNEIRGAASQAERDRSQVGREPGAIESKDPNRKSDAPLPAPAPAPAPPREAASTSKDSNTGDRGLDRTAPAAASTLGTPGTPPGTPLREAQAGRGEAQANPPGTPLREAQAGRGEVQANPPGTPPVTPPREAQGGRGEVQANPPGTPPGTPPREAQGGRGEVQANPPGTPPGTPPREGQAANLGAPAAPGEPARATGLGRPGEGTIPGAPPAELRPPAAAEKDKPPAPSRSEPLSSADAAAAAAAAAAANANRTRGLGEAGGTSGTSLGSADNLNKDAKAKGADLDATKRVAGSDGGTLAQAPAPAPAPSREVPKDSKSSESTIDKPVQSGIVSGANSGAAQLGQVIQNGSSTTRGETDQRLPITEKERQAAQQLHDGAALSGSASTALGDGAAKIAKGLPAEAPPKGPNGEVISPAPSPPPSNSEIGKIVQQKPAVDSTGQPIAEGAQRQRGAEQPGGAEVKRDPQGKIIENGTANQIEQKGPKPPGELAGNPQAPDSLKRDVNAGSPDKIGQAGLDKTGQANLDKSATPVQNPNAPGTNTGAANPNPTGIDKLGDVGKPKLPEPGALNPNPAGLDKIGDAGKPKLPEPGALADASARPGMGAATGAKGTMDGSGNLDKQALDGQPKIAPIDATKDARDANLAKLLDSANLKNIGALGPHDQAMQDWQQMRSFLMQSRDPNNMNMLANALNPNGLPGATMDQRREQWQANHQRMLEMAGLSGLHPDAMTREQRMLQMNLNRQAITDGINNGALDPMQMRAMMIQQWQLQRQMMLDQQSGINSPDYIAMRHQWWQNQLLLRNQAMGMDGSTMTPDMMRMMMLQRMAEFLRNQSTTDTLAMGATGRMYSELNKARDAAGQAEGVGRVPLSELISRRLEGQQGTQLVSNLNLQPPSRLDSMLPSRADMQNLTNANNAALIAGRPGIESLRPAPTTRPETNTAAKDHKEQRDQKEQIAASIKNAAANVIETAAGAKAAHDAARRIENRIDNVILGIRQNEIENLTTQQNAAKGRTSEVANVANNSNNDAALIAAMTARQLKEEKDLKEKLLQAEKNKKKDDGKRRKIVVKEKETLEIIAKRYMRDARLVPLLYEINAHILQAKARIKKGGEVQLVAGTILWLPSNDEVDTFRARLASGQIKNDQGDKPVNAQDELVSRFGANWDAHDGHGANPKTVSEADQTRRQNIESLLGPLSKNDDTAVYYTCRLGDTLKSIAVKHPALQDPSLWKLLAEINKLTTAVDSKGVPLAKIVRGSQIRIPDPKEVAEYLTEKRRVSQTKADEFVSATRFPSSQTTVVDPERPPEQKINSLKDAGALMLQAGGFKPKTKPLSEAITDSATPTGPITTFQSVTEFERSQQNLLENSKAIENVRALSDDCRIVRRHLAHFDGSRSFQAQLDVMVNGGWKVALVYNVSDNESWCQRFGQDGKVEKVKIQLPTSAIHQMLENDVNTNWQQYRDQMVS